MASATNLLRWLLRPGRAFLALLTVTVGLVLTAAEDGAAGLEYKVKAGYLINFAKFVEWPDAALPEAGTPLVIGLITPGEFVRTMEEVLAGRTVNGRALVLRRLGPDDDLSGCHVLFVGAAERNSAARHLERIRGRPILTVGESERFAQQGGVLNFILVDGQVRLESNPGAASAAGLKISSKLLNASRPVKTDPQFKNSSLP
jgi:hypothetical protein